MFVMCKRNVILPSADGKQQHKVAKDYVGNIPDWATETAYFRGLVSDGKIVVPETSADKDLQKAAEKPVKQQKADK